MGNSTPSTPSTSFHAIRPDNSYVCGVGILAVFAIGVCAFFAFNTFQPKNKKLINGKQDQPPIRRHLL